MSRFGNGGSVMSRRSELTEMKDDGLTASADPSGRCGVKSVCGRGPTMGLVNSWTGPVVGTLVPRQLRVR